MSEDLGRWLDGTQMLGVLLRRFANGGPVKITKEEVEAARFGTTHPVVFTIQPGGTVCELHVQLPGEKFAVDDETTVN